MRIPLLRKMKFFKKREKQKQRDAGDNQAQYLSFASSAGLPPSHFGRAAPAATRASARALSSLPDRVIDRIFVLVCPHSRDETYEKCEDSVFDDACPLCDLRDLASCAKVCRRWRLIAVRLLYHSIRIDPVHYCEREAVLAEKRKRRSFFDRNGEPEDTTEVRLKLLCRTLREDPVRLGPLVQFLKTPYMLRESRQADLARTIAVLPNLRYVDLPEGLFMDDPAYLTLRLEVQARCHDLRKMTYMAGSERSLENLVSGGTWPRLEVLELVRINAEPNMLRHVVACLGRLRALKVTEGRGGGGGGGGGPHCFTDDILCANPMFPEIPPLEELVLMGTAGLTVEGLRAYLARPDARSALRVLTLNGTGVRPWQLQDVLSSAPALRHLTIVDEVRSTLPVAAGTSNILPLASNSLRTLNYEIVGDSSTTTSPLAGITRSYYNYLSGSLMSGGLPNLRRVYVRDQSFPDSLLGLPPPMPAFADGAPLRRPASSGSSSTFASTTNNTNRPPLGSLAGAPVSPAGFLSPHHSPGFSPPHSAQLIPQHSGGNSNNYNNNNPFQDPPSAAAAKRSTPWAAGHNPRFSTNNPFAALISPRQVQTLEVFTKGDDDIDWSSVKVSPDDALTSGGGVGGGGGSATSALLPEPRRPVSSYGLASDANLAGARRSVLMNTGSGHFLAVPDPSPPANGSAGKVGGAGGLGYHGGGGGDEWPRPRSSAGEKKRERLDLWR